MSESPVPEICIDPVLSEHGLAVNIHKRLTAHYLASRHVVSEVIDATVINVSSCREYDYTIGRPVLGEYDPYEGVTIYGLNILNSQPRQLPRRRPDDLPPLREFWAQATLSQRFNYVLGHELEHLIHNDQPRAIEDYQRQALIEPRKNLAAGLINLSTIGPVILGLDMWTDLPLPLQMLGAATTLPLNMKLYMQVARRLNYNEYLTRPHEQRAHMAGLYLTQQLIGVNYLQ